MGSPAWHRKLRLRRQKARNLIQTAKGKKRFSPSFKYRFAHSVRRLTRHHSKPTFSKRHFPESLHAALGALGGFSTPVAGTVHRNMSRWYASQAWNAWNNQKDYKYKDKPKAKDTGVLRAYDGSKLEMPKSLVPPGQPASSSSSASSSGQEDQLRQALMSVMLTDPGRLPPEIVNYLEATTIPVTRQAMQKQLNLLRKLEVKLKKKQESITTRQTNWVAWRQSMKQIIQQESERYEQELKSLHEEVKSLEQEIQQEQEKLDTKTYMMHKEAAEMEEEDDLDLLLADPPKVPTSAHLVTPQIPTSQLLQKAENKEELTEQKLLSACQAVQLKTLQDPQWVIKHPELMSHMMKVATTLSLSTGSAVNASQVGSPPHRDPMYPFGNKKAERPGPYTPPSKIKTEITQPSAAAPLANQTSEIINLEEEGSMGTLS